MQKLLFTFLSFFVLTNLWSQNDLSKTQQKIKVNQIGYQPNSTKIAIVPEKAGSNFNIIDATTNKLVYSDKLTKAKEWEFSGEKVKIADFSDFKRNGKYYIQCENVEKSFIFEIGKQVNTDLSKAALHSFYLARMGVDLPEKYAGMYKQKAGHPDTNVLVHSSAASRQRPEGTSIVSPGGWYDAGDYGKYIVNSGISTYTLLHLYEMFPDYFKKQKLNIPENTNKVPDIVDETLYNLRWMLTMQDPNDGGVYHKLTTKKFGGMVKPHESNKQRYVVMKTTAATLDFVAVCAKASRILKPFEKEFPGLADSCLAAAKEAYKWAKQNPEILYKQPDDIKTGAYGDRFVKDEWAWAAIEMALTSGQSEYMDNDHLKTLKYNVPTWGSVGTLGVYSALNSSSTVIDSDLKKEMRDKFLKAADNLYDKYDKSAYKVSHTKFPWGSNAVAANEGMLLMIAYKISADIKYKNAAEATLNYILGVNPLNMCFVTGFGSQSPLHIHDRRSESDGIEAPSPGLIAGGPTKQARQDCGEDKYPSDFPAFSYLDKSCSYSTNEIAINWSAAFAYLINSIEVEKK